MKIILSLVFSVIAFNVYAYGYQQQSYQFEVNSLIDNNNYQVEMMRVDNYSAHTRAFTNSIYDSNQSSINTYDINQQSYANTSDLMFK
jgi:hypothetical protein